MTDLTKYFYQIAIDSRGLVYLDAEDQLIKLGQAAVPFLEEQSRLSTGLSQLITNVVLGHIQGSQPFKEALDYFDEVEQLVTGTPVMVPPPEPVAEYLFQHFGDAVASLLGVYLIKLVDIWPEWKILGVILYLGKLNSAVSADPLIQFISIARSEHQRKIALSSLTSVADGTTLSKIEELLNTVEGSQQALTQAANEIRAKLKP
jgi:hypothetical protein